MSKDGIDFTAVRSFTDMPYAVPNQQVDYAMRNGHVPVGFWRAPGLQNAYYRECFIDELAVAVGRDPLEYRLAMLKPGDKNRLVLDAVATAALGEPAAGGRASRLAVSDGFGSFTAMVAEVSVSAGELKVHRVVSAIDSGHVVNPDTCRAQAEGNIAFMLGATKYQENNVAKGPHGGSQLQRVPVARHFRNAQGGNRAGAHRRLLGRPWRTGRLCVAPALCNAIFAATGKRIRSLPLKHHDLRRA
jgi:isoquinoline 1-oxidoreductase beta subunit